MSAISIQSIYGARFYFQRRAVLVVNLGSPRSPEVADVRSYLTDFLMDEHVISLHHLLRTILVKGIIAPHRAPYSAQNYRTIWDEETKTFPLIAHTARIAEGLSERMRLPVAMAMRYGEPSAATALEALEQLRGLEEVVVLPLYPHYTRSSFFTAVEHIYREAKRLGVSYELLCVRPFYDHQLYREVLASSVRPYLNRPFDRLIVSLHGIPLSHLAKPCAQHNGDTSFCYNRVEAHRDVTSEPCYRLHCECTAKYLAQDLGLESSRVELVYQSRLGWHPWLRPYMKERIQQLPTEGVKDILVVCPGFVCDCLETYYEIDEEYHEEFLAAGGRSFTYIPCLNSSADCIDLLARLVDEV